MKGKLKPALVVTAITLYATFGWIAGLAILFVLLLVLARDAVRARRALAPEIVCPWCNARVPQYGAYSCGACHARTLGWAWRCSACGDWSGHIECSNCQMSIPNPLLPRP
jgi:ribosomal protein L40E